jgi:hypothetical protein
MAAARIHPVVDLGVMGCLLSGGPCHYPSNMLPKLMGSRRSMGVVGIDFTKDQVLGQRIPEL